MAPRSRSGQRNEEDTMENESPGLVLETDVSARWDELANLAFEQGYPAPETARRVREERDYGRAVEAYRFFYPTVSTEGMLEGNRQAGVVENRSMSIMSCGPKQILFTGNSDTPYGAGILDLKEGPMVVELPPGPFVALVIDHNQRWVQDMGIPGPDVGHGGKYLYLPPGFKGDAPAGFHVSRCPTQIALIAVRALPLGGDLQGALGTLRHVRIYPISKAANPEANTFVEFTGKPADFTCLKWEDNLKFWEKLHSAIETEPIFTEFRPMYGMLATLGIEKGKPFKPDARMRNILAKAAKAGRDQMLVEGFASERPDRMAWKDRRWEWVGLQPRNANFETPSELDIQARERWFIQAVAASPAMFRREAGSGSLYWLGLRDRSGAYLDGGKSYRLNVPKDIPAKLFWSVTAYDSRTRSEVASPRGKAALRSLFEKFSTNKDGSIDLFFGPGAPAGKESQWIQTSPGNGWFAYFRIYGPEPAAFDGTWKPGDFEEMK
jgi:hypothetical protein